MMLVDNVYCLIHWRTIIKYAVVFCYIFYNMTVHTKDIFFAPWRSTYEKEVWHGNVKKCPFCVMAGTDEQDAHFFVLGRFKHWFVILNCYPYLKGHVLIVPYRHAQGFEALSDEAYAEFMRLMIFTIDVFKKTQSSVTGVNGGFNLGENIGNSIPNHFHMHLIPRKKDEHYNFWDIIGEAHAISYDLRVVYNEMKPYFDQYKEGLDEKYCSDITSKHI